MPNKAMLTGPELGAAIRAAIKKKGLLQREVAATFGVAVPSVQDWMKYGRIDKKHLPRLFSLFADVVGPEHWGLEPGPFTDAVMKSEGRISPNDSLVSSGVKNHLQDRAAILAGQIVAAVTKHQLDERGLDQLEKVLNRFAAHAKENLTHDESGTLESARAARRGAENGQKLGLGKRSK
ncbi:hypothetical protein [Pararobbsia silviterrae]|nr:hypothetical protein [Pararobbsia silviterrae]